MRKLSLFGPHVLSITLLVVSITSTFACSSKKSFQGQTKENEASDAEASPSAFFPSSPTNCQTDSVTRARLLTTGLSRKVTQQLIRYELALVSCKDGSVLTLDHQVVLFDIDVVIDPSDRPVDYRVYASGSEQLLAADRLGSVEGSDLFGRRGPYSHWKTESFQFSNQESSIILEIDLKGFTLDSMIPKAVSVESYLKIGNSDPVEQTISLD